MTRVEEHASPKAVSRLQTPQGHYAMLALDQRESLRDMFPRDAAGKPVGDDALREFKQAGVEILSPHASAVLLDRPYSVTTSRPAGLAEGCGLVVAADVLHQVAGEAITEVTIDKLVTVDLLKEVGADAIKMLVLWHPSTGRDARTRLVEHTVELAAKAGVVSLVEGIVRPDHGKEWTTIAERHDAILACAAELTELGPDIYKGEVPGYLKGDVSKVAENSAEMSRIVGGDWVVLSNGVEKTMFASAVEEARKGGASGFLAGRAIWADTVAEADVRAALGSRSVERIERLTAIVDGHQ